MSGAGLVCLLTFVVLFGLVPRVFLAAFRRDGAR